MNDALKTLDKNEKVTVLYGGKVKAILSPPEKKKHLKIIEHPFFGMSAQDKNTSALNQLDGLRKPRYNRYYIHLGRARKYKSS